MPELNNPSDAFSEEFRKNTVLSELVRSWLRGAVSPDSLVVLGEKSIFPFESGFRIYRIGSDGPTGVYDASGVLPSTFSAFPGCQPVRVAIPPRSREIITLTGSNSNFIARHSYSADHKLTFLEQQPGIGTPTHMAFTSDGTTAYVTNGATIPNQINRYSRDPFSGKLTLNNGSNYPFGVGCAPVSLRTSSKDNIVFSASTTFVPLGIDVYKNFDMNSGTFASGSPFDPGANPTSQNNLCLLENERLLYMTIGDSTNPINGFRYDTNGTLTMLPNSPFAPEVGIIGGASTDNFSTTMTLDPQGKYLAFLYSISGTFYIRLLSIDTATGTLTPTSEKYSVGNAPKHLEWDGSGRFIYLVSDTGGTTNQFQLESFQFSEAGTLTRKPTVIIGPMGGDFSPKYVRSLPIYY